MSQVLFFWVPLVQVLVIGRNVIQVPVVLVCVVWVPEAREVQTSLIYLILWSRFLWSRFL